MKKPVNRNVAYLYVQSNTGRVAVPCDPAKLARYGAKNGDVVCPESNGWSFDAFREAVDLLCGLDSNDVTAESELRLAFVPDIRAFA